MGNIMITYEELQVFLFLLCVFIAIGMALFCIGIWKFSRETHIEPMKFEPKRTHKFPKIDISVAYQGAKAGHVLSGRK